MSGIIKIGFYGAPSSGKSTAAHSLKAILQAQGLDAVVTEEFARMHMSVRQDRINSLREQTYVMSVQRAMEHYLEHIYKPEVLISDSPLFLGEAFAKHYYPGEDHSVPEQIAASSRYNLLFYCPPLPIKQDDVRYQTYIDNVALNSLMNEWVNEHEVPHFQLPIDRAERIADLRMISRSIKRLYETKN